MVSDSVSKKFGIEKVSDSVSKKLGIEKSIGFGIEKNWYRKKVSDSVSLRFWVSSHTVAYLPTYLPTYLAHLLLSFFSCRNWITIENISLQLQSALSWPNSPNFYPTFLNCLICFSSYAGKVLFTVTVKWAVWRLFIDCHNTTWLANIVILSAIQHKLT